MWDGDVCTCTVRISLSGGNSGDAGRYNGLYNRSATVTRIMRLCGVCVKGRGSRNQMGRYLGRVGTCGVGE